MIKSTRFFILLSTFTFLLLFGNSLRAIDNYIADHNFNDVLLVINFNHPHYNNIPFLDKIYSPVFPNIVYYGEKKDSRVIQLPHHYGYWGHNVILDAMKRFPGYRGYLCVQDDCFMNFWNYSRFDKDKVWAYKFSTLLMSNKKANPWSWWNFDCGRIATKVAYKKMSKKHRQILQKNLGRNHVAYGYADFVYIPGRLTKEYIKVCRCFNDPQVFVEIAVPTILSSIEDINNWEIYKPCWGIKSISDYSSEVDWVHPIKFSDQKNKKFILKFIENIHVGP
jgi:hypothetical protein